MGTGANKLSVNVMLDEVHVPIEVNAASVHTGSETSKVGGGSMPSCPVTPEVHQNELVR